MGSANERWHYIVTSSLISLARTQNDPWGSTVIGTWKLKMMGYIDGLVQERRNSIANALELHLSCTNPSICSWSVMHDDVIKWKHFLRYWPFVRGEFTGHRWIPPTKGSDAELWCFLWSAPWINGWVNNREAGDLWCHHTHYDVTVISVDTTLWQLQWCHYSVLIGALLTEIFMNHWLNEASMGLPY